MEMALPPSFLKELAVDGMQVSEIATYISIIEASYHDMHLSNR